VQTTHNVATKVDKSATAKTTILVVDWGNTHAEVVNGPVGKLAAQQFIVHLQQGWRNNGIPAKYTAKILEYKSGGRVALTSEQMMDALFEGAKADPAERAKLEARLRSMGLKVA